MKLSPINPQSHGEALKIAEELLASLDPAECASRSGSDYYPDKEPAFLRLRFLGKSCRVDVRGSCVLYEDTGSEVDARSKLLIAHYLVNAKGSNPSGELIDFRHIPAGDFYFPVFTDTVTKPLIRAFREDPQSLLPAAREYGGKKIAHGDYGVIIPAFPRVNIIFALWAADEEFPTDGKVLFDKTIPDYLPTEDITILCKAIVERLIHPIG